MNKHIYYNLNYTIKLHFLLNLYLYYLGGNMIKLETSARHIHVTKEDLDTLYGPNYQLTKKKDLSQPGQYVCEEKVEVVGPKGSLKLNYHLQMQELLVSLLLFVNLVI